MRNQSIPSPVGAVIWFTGLSGSGKSTLAGALTAILRDEGHAAHTLDGDLLREGLNQDLGFSPVDRAENVRRIAHLAVLLADAGVLTTVSLISPYAADRARARAIVQTAGHRFYEVWVNAPLADCEARDPKGLYRRARRGEIPEFTGISAPYERPAYPDLEVRPDREGVGEIVLRLRALLDGAHAITGAA